MKIQQVERTMRQVMMVSFTQSPGPPPGTWRDNHLINIPALGLANNCSDDSSVEGLQPSGNQLGDQTVNLEVEEVMEGGGP